MTVVLVVGVGYSRLSKASQQLDGLGMRAVKCGDSAKLSAHAHPSLINEVNNPDRR
jgi:hypothetical protein